VKPESIGATNFTVSRKMVARTKGENNNQLLMTYSEE